MRKKTAFMGGKITTPYPDTLWVSFKIAVENLLKPAKKKNQINYRLLKSKQDSDNVSAAETAKTQ